MWRDEQRGKAFDLGTALNELGREDLVTMIIPPNLMKKKKKGKEEEEPEEEDEDDADEAEDGEDISLPPIGDEDLENMDISAYDRTDKVISPSSVKLPPIESFSW